MKSPKIRAYQRTAIESARRAPTKSGSCILQMPTGAGKTRAATEVIATSRGVIWFVCHRQEIERQAAKAFTAAGIKFGIVSPRGNPEYDKRVQIVSVGTLARRIKELPEPRLVIWDECHHAPAKSWAKLRAKLKNARHLGLTATPERLDGKGLREWFAQLVTGPGIAELIKKGFLSEFKYYAPSDPDLTKAKMQAGDYKKADLGKIMNTPVLIGDAVREYKKHAKGKRVLAFCASVEASQALAAKFNQSGIKARHVDGATPTAERDAAVQDLAVGKIKVLTNVEVFTEGFDLPAIDAVILMRPTKSPTLLLQMIGRGLRRAKNKDVALIFDHAGLHRDHAWFADDWHWSLDGGAAKARRKAVTRGPRRCPECKEVRAERIEVCSCGYELPTGREIGEFDGVLTEVRGVVPDGCETRYRFGLRHGISNFSVGNLIERGLPSDGVFVLAGADNWLLAYRDSKEVSRGFVTINKFANKVGVSVSAVRKWISKGMPVQKKKYGSITPYRDAIAWLRQNVNLKSTVLRSKQKTAPEGKITLVGFAKRIGFARHTSALRLVKHGLPFDGKFVPLDEADAWIRANPSKLLMARKLSKAVTTRSSNRPVGCETVHAFSKRISVFHDTVKKYIRQGMPTNGKFVKIIDALKWVEENINSFESRASFARRVGVVGTSITNWIVDRGLPYDPKRGIPIQAGLEWVRDNRPDIKIPASAWPKPPKRKHNDTAPLA
jgi:superfamily II DNA or RNA helicase